MCARCLGRLERNGRQAIYRALILIAGRGQPWQISMIQRIGLDVPAQLSTDISGIFRSRKLSHWTIQRSPLSEGNRSRPQAGVVELVGRVCELEFICDRLSLCAHIQKLVDTSTMAMRTGNNNAVTPCKARLATGKHRVLLYITCYNVLDGYVCTIVALF